MQALLDRESARRLRDQENFGAVCAAAMNAAGGKKGGGVFVPSDFFPALATKQKPPTPKAQAAYADFLAVWANAKAEAEKQK